MKRFTLLKTMLLLCALIVGSGSAWGQVTSVAPENGKSYVVAAYINSKYYALPNGAVNGSTIAGTEISLNALNKVNTSVAAGNTWTLQEGTGTNAGKYYIKYTSGTDTYYLYKNGTKTTNYNFAVNKSSKNYWTFTTNGTGYTVTAVDRESNNLYIQCNSGTFRCYSTATPIILLEIGNVAGQVETPSFSPTGGTYNTVQSVTINCGTDGATIHYTTDGTEPTTSSPTYSTALSVTSTTTIKAIAVKNGLTNSAIATATYNIVYPEASLPFAFNGGKTDIDNTSGLTHSGLGTDYSANTNPNTQLKFDSANDELVLRINDIPGKLTFSIKGNGDGKDAWSGTFKVQESANGSSYTDVASYTNSDLSSSETAKTITLKSTTRYIKWIYTTKTLGNVALGNINLTKTELVSITDAGYATYVSDNDLDYSGVTGLKAYQATLSGSKITFTKVTTVPAGEGVLLQGEEGDYNVPVTTDVAAWDADDNAFVRGTGAAVPTSDGGNHNYILSNGDAGIGFYQANGTTVATNRAYLQTTTSGARIGLNFDDETTGISAVENVEPSTSKTVVFNLNGQRIANPSKGLYIVNGKKVIIK